MVNLDGSPVQVKFDFTMQGRTKQFSDTFGIGIQLRGFALGRWSSGMTLPLHPSGGRKNFGSNLFPKGLQGRNRRFDPCLAHQTFLEKRSIKN